MNLVLVTVFAVYLFWPSDSESSERSLVERHYSGENGAADKVAVVRISGLLIETGTEFAHRQIERAAKDKSVKVVVVRIDSPGGPSRRANGSTPI
ncbi:hypothetical protein FRUB_00527 [Fimbriiglobus ruber]|uniref:Signal peptide peptidase SppA, 36K type n=1 Tax=Fimbriiglobus ruber TaxID=1908690 RepID=A0A225E7T8_9BACT|nr:hypothetical protein FRUB_00527 [Fimbriiglobus ruber]